MYYSTENKYDFSENKKVIGKMKDEAVGIPITEFVGLRSKMYSYMKNDLKNENQQKELKNINKKDLQHENYKIYYSMINKYFIK